MDNVDLNVLRQVAAWQAAGQRVVLGTVTRTWGSAPRPVGSLVAVRGDGTIAGSVSGGCIEDDLMEKVRQGALALEKAEVVKYGVGAEEAKRFGLPCGGTMELVLEPVTAKSRIGDLLDRLATGRRVRRELDLATAEVQLAEPGDGDALQLTAERLISTHGPRWRLLVIGAGQLTQYLARMAQALDYEVIVCDPREEYEDEPDLAGVTRLRTMPDDTVTALKPDGHMAIVALTHDPKLDDLALMEALGSESFYVGAIGSRVNQAKRKQRLAEHFGITEAQLARLHGPVGLRIGARTPPEIAVAILAEMTAARYGVKFGEGENQHAASGAEAGCSV
jgi:xanthine dehydrogenase accessory factor